MKACIMSEKLPDKPVRGSTSGRPIMVLLDVLGQRWTLRILWELRDGCVSFRELRALCDGVSPTLLNQRLKQLRSLHLVSLEECGFQLTPQGQQLGGKFAELDGWATGWAAELAARDDS